ncbi:Indoleamine 2,3-dioxygenase [Dichomitus squalens]|uniref:Indoleamine 2,3-dioxygenase n=1 Tax=Dichomitus squalens TaxID=114155 RepID=A0A4Q9NQL0_9APHY|nr:Indoleamine 2,3-dioxygenase [Dichomitus squalens]TBU41646.1 Indoleamine 2,3-dioxygenase [Dichomitus squalens]TBU55451.1 Indoleamine 2,3-dioxygenase [Dichomitus squalens]
MDTLPPNHFLNLQRPDAFVPTIAGTPDTSTLAAHDFDVDTRTGFMPPQPPLARLPEPWEPWEAALDDAITSGLQLADKPDLSDEDEKKSERWRNSVRELPILSITELKNSEILLRRAHHVLAWVMHFYVHTMPSTMREIHIPPPVTVPLLQVCAQLQLPPVLTYSDDVLYNWAFKTPLATNVLFQPKAELHNLRCLTLFTGTRDEEEFYLSSARIELRGVEALSVMRAIMDEAFVGDEIAHRRITDYLRILADVIKDMQALLAAVREGCDPTMFYNQIRPWFKGADSDTRGRKWVFDGIELDPTLEEPTELSGPSAGQSSLVHALDIFLGVDRYSHSDFHGQARPASASASSSAPPPSPPTSTFSSAPVPPKVPFLTRMQSYMPRHHRAFLRHLQANPRPLRTLVEQTENEALREAYDVAVTALKEFRDEHVRIVALYILIPSRQAHTGEPSQGGPKGTGGTDAFQFVKGVRDQTAGALLGRPTH